MIRTPDQRVRVFVSSTLTELAAERSAVRSVIERLRLTPVMFELGARPYPPRALYRAYLQQSQIFVGVYGESYGWVAPGETISGLEDEYVLSTGLPRLLYVRDRAPDRQPRLSQLLHRIEADDTASYRRFNSPAELERLLADDLMLLLSERFESLAAAPLAEAPPVELRLSPAPLPLTPILGRDAQVEAVGRLLKEKARLVTVTGAGGIGKSRLVVEVTRRLAGELPDVHFMPLSGLTRAADVMTAIAAGLGVPLEGNLSPTELLIVHLKGRPLLLVLDNFEQVAEAAPELVRLLDGCPALQLLVTSRQVLRLRGEREFPLAPLPVPAPGEEGDEALQNPAVQLFVDRARAVHPAFVLEHGNVGAVAEICRRLDGLPLAIELAAARVRLLSPGGLLARLSTRLNLLTAGAVDMPERQRTLRATIDWSFQLLSPGEQALFVKLAVFVDGWTLDAAEVVCADGAEGALETMTSLLEKSLLVVVDSQAGGEPRLRMLGTVREYAEERLLSTGEYARLRQGHADYYLRLVEEHEGELRRSGHEVWSERLDAEAGNIRTAVQWWLDREDYESLARLAWATFLHYWLRGGVRELTDWMAAVPRSSAALSDRSRARLLVVQGFLTLEQGLPAPAKELVGEAVESLERMGGGADLAMAWLLYGQVLASAGETVTAARYMEQGREHARGLGDVWMTAMGEWVQGLLEMFAGDLEASGEHCHRALELSTQTGHRDVMGTALGTLGFVTLLKGDLVGAHSTLVEAVEVLRTTHYREGLTYCLQGLAAVAAASGQLATAARALSAAQAARAQIGVRMSPQYEVPYEALRRQLEDGLGPDFATTWAAGQALELNEALEEAIRISLPARSP
jgi:predicted ATPase